MDSKVLLRARQGTRLNHCGFVGKNLGTFVRKSLGLQMRVTFTIV